MFMNYQRIRNQIFFNTPQNCFHLYKFNYVDIYILYNSQILFIHLCIIC